MEGGDQPEPGHDQAENAIEQLIVFQVDGEEYAVPINAIREVVEVPAITPVPDSLPFVLGIMNLRGKIVPVLDLKKRLNLTVSEDTKRQHVIVTEHDGNLMGIQVDEVKEVLKVRADQIQPTPGVITSKVSPEFLKGVVVIGDSNEPSDDIDASTADAKGGASSRVLLLLELGKIISSEELDNLHQASPNANTEDGNAGSNESQPDMASSDQTTQNKGEDGSQ